MCLYPRQCPGCPSGDLDLSTSLFERLAGSLDQGRLQGSWTFGNSLVGSSDGPASVSGATFISAPSTSSSLIPQQQPSTVAHRSDTQISSTSFAVSPITPLEPEATTGSDAPISPHSTSSLSPALVTSPGLSLATSSSLAASPSFRAVASTSLDTSLPVVMSSRTTALSTSTDNSIHGSATPSTGSPHPPTKGLIIALPVVLVFLAIITVAFALGRRRRFSRKMVVPLDIHAAPPLLSQLEMLKGMALTGGDTIFDSRSGALRLGTNFDVISDSPALSNTPSCTSQHDSSSHIHSTYAQYGDPPSLYGVPPDSQLGGPRDPGPVVPSASTPPYALSTNAPSRLRPPKARRSPIPRVPFSEPSEAFDSPHGMHVVIDHPGTSSIAGGRERGGVFFLPAFLQEQFLAFLGHASSGRQRRESVGSEPLPAYEPRSLE